MHSRFEPGFPRFSLLLVYVCLGFSGLRGASVSGTVYVWEDQSRRPAADVRVVAQAADGQVLVAVQTDSSGRYQFPSLPQTDVLLSTSKPGFVARRSAEGAVTSLNLTANPNRVNQDFELISGGVISGRITDPQGEPLERVRIEVRRPGVSDASPMRSITDDRGIYRVFGLAPGGYIMLAQPSDPDGARVFFPGYADSSRAQPIDVGAGRETAGIDLQLPPSSRSAGLAPLDLSSDSPELSPALIAAQDENLGSIGGTVLSSQTGELLKGASVTISATIDGKIVTETRLSGPAGAFQFDRLPPSFYSLQATKAGYALRNLTRQIQVAEKQNRTGFEMKLDRMPVISGHIRDREGRPVTGADVAVYQLRYQNERRIAAAAGSAVSDDRGNYRVSNLLPGRYFVSASMPVPPGGSPRGELDLGWGRTYYPSASRPAQAVLLELRFGQEASEINIDLAAQETYSVSGVVADVESGGPCLLCVIRAVSLDESYGFTQAQSHAAPNGAYVVRGLQPGMYRLLAEKKSGGRKSVTSQIVDIGNRDVTGINLVAGVVRGFSGYVVFETEPPPAAAADPKSDSKAAMTIGLTTPEGIGTLETAHVEKDRSFRFSGLSSDEYAIQIVGLPAGAYLKAVRVGGREFPALGVDMREQGPQGPVELLVSFNSGNVAGQVNLQGGGRDEAPPPATVQLYPRENQPAYLASRRAGTRADGSFRLNGIPPGSYIAFAAVRDSTRNLEDPALQKEMARYGKYVEIEPGKSAVLELPVIPED